MADSAAIRKKLLEQGMGPPENLDSILAGYGDVPPGYWDDAETPGMSADDAALLKAQIRDAQAPNGGGRWDGETDQEFAERTAPLGGMNLAAANGPSPAAIEPDDTFKQYDGESDEDYIARTAPLDRSKKLWPSSGPSPKGVEVASFSPEFHGDESEVDPIVSKIVADIPGGVARNVASMFVPRAIVDQVSAPLPPDVAKNRGPTGPIMNEGGVAKAAEQEQAKRFAPDPRVARQAAPGAAPASGGGSGLGTEAKKAQGAFDEAAGGAEKKLADATDMQTEGVLGQAQAQAAAADDVASIMDAAYNKANELETKRLEDDAAMQKALGNVEKDYNDAADEFRKQKVDPDRFWSNKSVGKKIGNAVAIFLGGLAQGFLGTKSNAAMDFLQKQIDDDISAQQQGIAVAREGLGAKQNGLTMMRARFADSREAAAAAKANAWELVQQQIQGTMAKYKAPEIQARGQELLGQAQQKAEEWKMQLKSLRAENAQRFISQRGQLALQSEQIAASKAERGGTDTKGMVPGLEGRAISKEAQNEAAEALGASTNVLGQLKDLRSFVTDKGGIGSELFPTDQAKQAQAMAASLRIEMGKNIFKLGVLSGDDIKMLNDVIPEDPTQFNQGAVRAKLAAAESYVKRKTEAYLKARGLRMAQTKQAGPAAE